MDKPSLQECYKTLQDNCNIKVGDQVKVLRKAKNYEIGWNTVWIKAMDKMIGNTYRIKSIHPEDGFLLDNNYYLPFFVLEKVESAEVLEITMQEVEDKFGCEVKIIKGEDDEISTI